MLVGIVLLLLQYAAAVPWLLALSWRPRPLPGEQVRRWGPLAVLGVGLACAVALGVLLGLFVTTTSNRETLETVGKYFAALLQLQLYTDVIVLIFAVLLWLWPKGGAVARAAFREGYRQPLFWMVFGLGSAFLLGSPFVPYFTFGEDYVVLKELGFDFVLLAGTVFGVLAAQSVTEEIEGRTAITLMSKPVSRRQFLLGKFCGIFLCALMMVLVLGWMFDLVLIYKRWFERMDPIVLEPAATAWITPLGLSLEGQAFLRGVTLWGRHTSEVVPGLIMSAMLVMVLTAVAVTLAVRTPLIVNLTTCAFIYVVANLMPLIVLATRGVEGAKANPVQKLLHFTARLFDSVLPSLELFRTRPTLFEDESLPLSDYMQHVAAVSLYGFMFTAIILLLGLVLFEDRDLA